MSLYSGAPFWLVRNGLPHEAPPLLSNAEADVLVVGGGITGALVADALATAGRDVLLVDARIPGTGSTAASTALLQYEIDRELGELIDMIGEAAAVEAYRCAVNGVDRLREISASLDAMPQHTDARRDPGFQQRNSLYLASRRRDGVRLEAEVALRERFGIPAEFWSRERVESTFGFESYGAVFSDHAATIDPMRLTAALLERARANGARIAGRTGVRELVSAQSGLIATLDRGSTVRADHVVIATGYESPVDLVRPYVQLRSTYALATEPVATGGRWNDGTVVWETRRPYGYMRTTVDGRILAGGEDVGFSTEGARDVLLHGKTARIVRRLSRLLPDVEIDVAHAWTGTFGETADGLPYIGEHPAMPNVIFALGYGGNGITFSAIAADLIVQLVSRQQPREASLFGFARRTGESR